MRVEVRLYATFAQYSPSGRAGDPFHVDVELDASLTSLITKLGIPEEVHLAIVNGRILHDRTQVLLDADRVALFPPIGGG